MTKTIKFGNVAYTAVAALQDVDLTAIDVPENRARSFDPAEAAGLAASISEVGLLHPIRVRLVGNRHRLIAGRKRLEACRLLGWNAIPVTVSNAKTDDDARLEEVMENLGRFELSKLDRCQHLYELKHAYPAAGRGGDRGNQHTGGKVQNLDFASASGEVFGFSTVAAEKTGLSRAAIFSAVKLWTDLTPDSRKRAAGTWLADHQSGLKELSEQTPADQARVLDMVLADPPTAATIAEAVAILKTGVALTAAEKKIAVVNKGVQSLARPVAVTIGDASRLAELKEGIATLTKFLGKLEDEELDSVIVEHEDRIIASLKRRGRI